MPMTLYTQEEYQDLQVQLEAAKERVKALYAMQPQWTEEAGAYTKAVALQQVWSHLGVDNQTHCMQKLKAITSMIASLPMETQDYFNHSLTKSHMVTQLAEELGLPVVNIPLIKD